MYSTRLHVHTRASLTDILARILAKKSAHVGQVGGQVGEDRRACPARAWQAERGSRRTRRHPRDDRAEVGDDVRVGVGVDPVEFPVEFQLNKARIPRERHRHRHGHPPA